MLKGYAYQLSVHLQSCTGHFLASGFLARTYITRKRPDRAPSMRGALKRSVSAGLPLHFWQLGRHFSGDQVSRFLALLHAQENPGLSRADV
jgi:hypothetical protein